MRHLQRKEKANNIFNENAMHWFRCGHASGIVCGTCEGISKPISRFCIFLHRFFFFFVHTANGSLLLFLSKNIHFTPIISVNQTNFAAKILCDEKKKNDSHKRDTSGFDAEKIDDLKISHLILGISFAADTHNINVYTFFARMLIFTVAFHLYFPPNGQRLANIKRRKTLASACNLQFTV